MLGLLMLKEEIKTCRWKSAMIHFFICGNDLGYSWRLNVTENFFWRFPQVGTLVQAAGNSSHQPPWKAACRGTSRTCSSAKKLLFTVVLLALELFSVLVWPGYAINLDLSEKIMLRKGKQQKGGSGRSSSPHHVHQPGHPYEKFM